MPKEQTLEDFKALMDKIHLLLPNSKFLFIEQYTEQPFNLSVTDKKEQSFWLKFSAIDKNTGVQYLNSVDDEIMKIIYAGLKQN